MKDQKQRARRGEFDPRALSIREQGGVHTLFNGNAPVTTPGGRPVAHTSPRLVELIRREAEIAREFDPHALSAYAQFVTEFDFVRAGQDPIERQLDGILAEEEPVLDRAEGAEGEGQLATWRGLTGLLAENGVSLPPAGEDAVPPAFAERVRALYTALDPARRTAVITLFRVHHAGVLVPLAFASGRMTVSEYAEGLLAMHRAHARLFDADWKSYTDNFVIAREDASIVREYLDVVGG